jgi:prepilin-type N-terminal cleavage/methylation domain-containing protein
MVKNNLGFTLIELVAVIVLLGILAVTALARFVNLSSDAHLAVFQSTFGAFKSGMNSANLVWITRGSPTGVNAINVNENLDYNNLGYPAGIDDGSQVSTPSDCLAIFENILQTSLVAEVPVGDGAGIKNLAPSVDVAVTNNNNVCYYTFVSESKSIGYNARQFRYLYTTGSIVEWPAGFTLN